MTTTRDADTRGVLAIFDDEAQAATGMARSDHYDENDEDTFSALPRTTVAKIFQFFDF